MNTNAFKDQLDRSKGTCSFNGGAIRIHGGREIWPPNVVACETRLHLSKLLNNTVSTNVAMPLNSFIQQGSCPIFRKHDKHNIFPSTK